MKKFTFLFVALLCATTILAQPSIVSIPSSAEIEDYTLTGKNYYYPEDETVYEDLNETIKVAFDGNDVYIQGLCGYLPNAWVKGTRSGDEVTFATGQYYGSYEDGTQSYQMFFCGYSGSICDVVFQYNEVYGIFKTDTWILSNGSTTMLNAYHYLTEVMLLRGAAEQDEAVTPPENLSTLPYIFSATRIVYNGDGFQYDNIERDIKVGFAQNNELYIQGLCEQLPEAWVVGTLTGEEATFASGQYYGTYSDEDGEHKLYFAGSQFSELTDMTFDYERATGNFTSTKYLVLNSTKDTYSIYEQYANVKLTRNPNNISNAETFRTTVAEQYFDINGQEIINDGNRKGVVFVKQTFSDGSEETRKILR